MAGPNPVIVQMQSDHCFRIDAKPAHLLSRIPFIGPFFTYNLGRNPKFELAVTYQGLLLEHGQYNTDALPDWTDTPFWNLDIVLEIAGNVVAQVNDDLKIMVKQVATGTKQLYVTNPMPLIQPGEAQLQVGLGYYPSAYTFEVQDISRLVTSWIVGLILTIFGGLVGGLVGYWLAVQ